MCDELIKSFNLLKNDITLSDDDREYIKQSKLYPIRRIYFHEEFYEWKKYDKIKFYRNYDNIYDTLKTGSYSAPLKVGKRKLNKEIRIFGLPEHCYK